MPKQNMLKPDAKQNLFAYKFAERKTYLHNLEASTSWNQHQATWGAVEFDYFYEELQCIGTV